MQKRYNIKLYIFTFIMLIIATLLFFYRIHLANEGYVVAKMSQHHLGINLISSIKKVLLAFSLPKSAFKFHIIMN